MRLFDEEFDIRAGYDNFFLDDIFRQKEYGGIYDDMMNTRLNHISFLNKGLCGNGGTTGLIRYALAKSKGLMVLVPNVSICKSKEQDYNGNPDVCCVYGGSEGFNPDAQVVVATYDQFPSLLHRLKPLGVKTGADLWEMTFWGGRTIVIDEYHKLIDDSGYREVCPKMTELICNTGSPVILMSATPNEDYIWMIRELLPERTIINYSVLYQRINPKYETRIDVYDVRQKELKDIFWNMLNSPKNHQICVFLNCVKEIKSILGQIGDDRCEVLCSSDSRDKVGKYYSEQFDPDKKLHFLTSAYFTGNDIWTDVDKCVIVGSGEFDYMALGERDIKQIIGRFRKKEGGVRTEGVQLFYMKRMANQNNYLQAKNTKDKIESDMKVLGDKWMQLSDGIAMMNNLLRTKDVLRRFEMWSSYGQLEKALTDYGFCVNKVDVGFLKNMEKSGGRKHLTFKKAKERLENGQDVDFDEYPDVNELKTFIKIKGMSDVKNRKVGKQDIHNWYKAYQMSRGSDLNVEKSRLPDVFGIQTFGRYNAKYLNACLVFLDDEAGYDHLAADMYDKMLCYAVPWKLDSKGHKYNGSWLVITHTPKYSDFLYDGPYRAEREKSLDLGERVIGTNISYETSNTSKSYAKTISLGDAVKTGKMARLTGIPMYDWVMEDKENRLPEVKKGKGWKDIKLYSQTKISEMYSATDKTYRYIRSEMNLADSLIIDIDGGMPFSEFKEKYGRWTWLAYPTISNVSENWTKFRVIVPLAHTIRLEGEHNLKVLKLLRTMFCPYEDPEHQVYSFVCMEDFTRLQGNVGETYDIPQEFVDCLGMCLKESYDYNSKKFDRKAVSFSGCSGGNMTLNDAKTLFLKALANPEEGARHKVLYPIKKSLSDADRNEFAEWLSKVYPAYVKHWNSHRI